MQKALKGLNEASLNHKLSHGKKKELGVAKGVVLRKIRSGRGMDQPRDSYFLAHHDQNLCRVLTKTGGGSQGKME